MSKTAHTIILCHAIYIELPNINMGLTDLHDSCCVSNVLFRSLKSLALTSMSLRDFPLLYEIKGGSLNISLSNG